MSVSGIINSATGKIYDELIPEGGGINLKKGQLITALADTTEVAFPTVPPANGSVLSYDATTTTGLRYIANNPTAITLNYQQLFSATAGNNLTPVPASLHNNYVLTSDTDPANPTGLTWKAVAGSGIIQTNDPLYDEEVANVSTISINFGAVAGQIPYGTGVARTGALTNTPANASQFLGIQGGVPTWKPLTDSVVGIAPIVEFVGAGDESQIAIGFGAVVGQIPYGTGVVNTGTLTNTPIAGQILGMAGNPAVPTWIPAGGSGTITATLPLIESQAGQASNIAIAFTAKGQIPVGTLPAGTGAILPLGTDKQILTVNPKIAYGIAWTDPPSSVSTTIYRSNVATLPISPPISNTETLILVAEDTGATWDAVPASIFGFPGNPYQPQFVFTTTNGNEYAVNMEYIQQFGAATALTACLYQTYPTNQRKEIGQFWGFSNQTPTFVCDILELSPTNVIIMGSWVKYVPVPNTTAPFISYNLVSLNSNTNVVSIFSPNSWGLGPDPAISPTFINGSVQGYLYPTPYANQIIFYGSFNSAYGIAGGTVDDGYLNCAIYNTTTNLFLSSALTTVANRFGFFKPAGFDPLNPAYKGGEIRQMLIDLGNTRYIVGGNFTTCGNTVTNVPIEGFCGYNYGSLVSSATTTTLGASPIIINSMAFSTTTANKIIISGSITNNISFVDYALALVVNPITGAIPPAGQVGGYGCITSGSVIPGPAPPAVAVQLDAVMVFNPTGAYPSNPFVPVISKVYYFTTAGGLLSTLLPATNIIYSSNFMGQNLIINPYLGTITPPPQTTLLALGSNAFYLWDTDQNTTMTFNMPVGKFINKYNNPQYSNFSMTAGSSQAFISNQSATNWIVSNGIVVGGVFS